MIEAQNVFEDLRSDEIGRAISSLRGSLKWNSEKHRLKEELFERLTASQYVKAVGTRSKFRMLGGIGFSFIYLVPPQKRGQFKPYSGQFLRLVYTASAKNYLEIRFGVVDTSQVGRNFFAMGSYKNAEEFDPRKYYRFAFGESEYKPIK